MEEGIGGPALAPVLSSPHHPPSLHLSPRTHCPTQTRALGCNFRDFSVHCSDRGREGLLGSCGARRCRPQQVQRVVIPGTGTRAP